MKKNIHPVYKETVFVMPDGEEFVTMSACSDRRLRLDVDFRKHFAWSGTQSEVNSEIGSVLAFKKRFDDINFG